MDKYRNEVNLLISKLTDRGKVLFGALTTERLYPNYIAFEREVNWGDHKALSDAISLVFQWLVNDKLFTKRDIEDMIAKVGIITPDTEDFSSILTSFALDACTSILDLMQFILDKDHQYITNIATYARDTVDMFIQEKEDMNSLDPSIDIQIEHDDFMIKEKQTQKQLIDKIANMNLDEITDQMLNTLRTNEPIIDLCY